MTQLRPECRTAKADTPCLYGSDAYFRILQAVNKQRGLIHGKLHDHAGHCAIGCAFDDGVPALPTSIIDEVAAYNDSFPHLSRHERWRKVRDWLRFRLGLIRPRTAVAAKPLKKARKK